MKSKFNNSLYDSFNSSNSDEISINNSDINYQNNLPIFENEFDSNIIKNLLQNSRPRFKSESKKTKRGRPNITNKRKRAHLSTDVDNIISKIQVHFLNFMISFINDSINGFFKYQKFKFLNFSHKEKSKVTVDYLNEMKNSTIGELLLKMNISSKYKRCKDININRNNLKQLEQNPFFESLFKIKYLDLFSKYHNNKQPPKELFINDKKIILSNNTKTFSELLEKNKELKNDIIEVAEKFYINDINTNKDDDY